MNKIEEIKKELEKSLGYNFNNWGKGDLQMLEEIVEANNKVVKNLALCAVSSMFSAKQMEKAYNDGVEAEQQRCGYFDIENYC
tara:strand:+ start:3844 stop:4092 length:249 start_codon:yes stop_codon:yes gene_type:complete